MTVLRANAIADLAIAVPVRPFFIPLEKALTPKQQLMHVLQVVILQRQLDAIKTQPDDDKRPASAISERTRQRMRRDRAVMALGLEDAMRLPHGVLAELVQV